jgi:hypothetical protein
MDATLFRRHDILHVVKYAAITYLLAAVVGAGVGFVSDRFFAAVVIVPETPRPLNLPANPPIDPSAPEPTAMPDDQDSARPRMQFLISEMKRRVEETAALMRAINRQQTAQPLSVGEATALIDQMITTVRDQQLQISENGEFSRLLREMRAQIRVASGKAFAENKIEKVNLYTRLDGQLAGVDATLRAMSAELLRFSLDLQDFKDRSLMRFELGQTSRVHAELTAFVERYRALTSRQADLAQPLKTTQDLLGM